jgi:hypothetical protein
MQTCSIWCRAGQPSSSSTAAPEGSTKQFAIRQEGQFQAGTRGRGWGDEGGSQCGGPSGVGQSGLQASQQTNSALQHYSTANVIDNCVSLLQHSMYSCAQAQIWPTNSIG